MSHDWDAPTKPHRLAWPTKADAYPPIATPVTPSLDERRRAYALRLAVQLETSYPASAVLTTAQAFEAYLRGDEPPARAS